VNAIFNHISNTMERHHQYTSSPVIGDDYLGEPYSDEPYSDYRGRSKDLILHDDDHYYDEEQRHEVFEIQQQQSSRPGKWSKICILITITLGVLALVLSLDTKASNSQQQQPLTSSATSIPTNAPVLPPATETIEEPVNLPDVAEEPQDVVEEPEEEVLVPTDNSTNGVVPETCTAEQLQAIEAQLPTDEYCWRQPWKQKCPISNATFCPRPTWIWNYYARNDLNWTDSTFAAIDIGCNNGYHGVQTLRMGAYDESVTVATWNSALQSVTGGQPSAGRCDSQNPDQQIDISPGSIPRSGKMFCIEPLPINYDALTKANDIAQYQPKGLEVFHYSISNQVGTHYFPITDMGDQPWEKNVVGQANMYIGGMSNCDNLSEDQRKEKCASVDVLTLDSFVTQYVPEELGTINVLLSESNVDYEVLSGGANALKRTEYVEFQYSWKGTWPGKKLSSVTDMLDQIGFTCYWAGKSNLWRITSCWRDAYDTAQFIATVACVNRNLVESEALASDMERIFLETINV